MDTAATQERLRRAGLRVTRPRELVYALLAGTDRHPSAEELHRWLEAIARDGGDAEGARERRAEHAAERRPDGRAAPLAPEPPADDHEHRPVSLATVYNTLEAFTEAGLCRRLPGEGKGPARYDADVEPHIHLFTADGRVHDAPAATTARLLERLAEVLPPAELAALEAEFGAPIVRMSVERPETKHRPAPGAHR